MAVGLASDYWIILIPILDFRVKYLGTLFLSCTFSHVECISISSKSIFRFRQAHTSIGFLMHKVLVNVVVTTA